MATDITKKKFESPEKVYSRLMFYEHLKPGANILGLLGNGTQHEEAKRLGFRPYSIDDGTNRKDRDALKRDLTGEDKQLTSVYNFCQTYRGERFEGIDLDYCGQLTKRVKADLRLLPNIMSDTGIIAMTIHNQREQKVKGQTRKHINNTIGKEIQATLRSVGINVSLLKEYRYFSKTEGKKTGTYMYRLIMKYNRTKENRGRWSIKN